MKHLVLVLALLCASVHADATSDRIAEIKAEIAQRQAAIAQMKADGKPTGRYEMTVFRLQRELEKLELFQ
jgi:hypothetical protein